MRGFETSVVIFIVVAAVILLAILVYSGRVKLDIFQDARLINSLWR